jgi:CBS domain-containing protein
MARLVKDYMVKKKEIVDPQDAVISAIEVMVENDVGSVLVVDKDEKLVGIFTERDLLRHYLETQSKFLYMTVGEVMSSPVISVTPDMKMADALDLMAEKDIRHVPVLDKDDRCVGYITWKNLFKQFSKHIKQADL